MAKTQTGEAKTAQLCRMVTKQHICPFGIKSAYLLRRKGYAVEDHHLTSRAEVDSFKSQHNVKTTPQVFIGGERIGGYEELRRYFGKRTKDSQAITYQPVIAIFISALLMALAASWAGFGVIAPLQIIEWFIAFSMCLLALQKLKDLDSFSRQFLGYDLLAQRIVPYSYIYPFAEFTAGALMIAGMLPWVFVPMALFIGLVGAVSVCKAVYIDKRELKCACVGGNSRVPLGFVSLTENVMMVAMAIWMSMKHWIL